MLETTKIIPEGYCAIEDSMQLKRLINEKLKKDRYVKDNLEAEPQFIYIYNPKRKEFVPKWYWGAIPDIRIEPLIKKGLVYAHRQLQ